MKIKIWKFNPDPFVLLIVGSLFSPFSFLHLLVIGSVYFLIKKYFGIERALFSIWLGTIFLWVGIFITYSVIPLDYNIEPVFGYHAVSGAPLKIFYYPYPPFGSDRPPISQFNSFYIDYIFWIGIALILPKKISAYIYKETKQGKPLALALAMISFGFMLAGLIHVLLKFD